MSFSRPIGRNQRPCLRRLDAMPTRHSPPRRGRYALALSLFTLAIPVASSAQSPTWQPRPLTLPPTSAQATPWRPPEVTPATPAQAAPTTIVITAPTPPPAPPEPPTAAEIRRERQAEIREAEKLAKQENSRPLRALPASDQINVGVRKSQLAESVVSQLRIAHWARERGASQSARESARETLRLIALLRDSETRSDQHTRRLNDAFTAIREAGDFAGRYGPVGSDAIGRLIEVHQTPVLKRTATSGLTPPRVIEAYLGFARQRLVDAAQGGPLAAEAVLILADLQSDSLSLQHATQTDEASRLYAGELGLMYRRAAVEIAPDNPQTTAQLGRTLLKRSMPVAARDMLLDSVRQKPTRQNTENLMKAASLAGDFVTVDACEKMLRHTELPSELPYQFLAPQTFAATSTAVPPAKSFAPATPTQRIATAPYPQARPRGLSSQIVDPTLPTGSRSASPHGLPTSPPVNSPSKRLW